MKKNKLFSLLSIFTICGSFALCSMLDQKDRTLQTNAISLEDISNISTMNRFKYFYEIYETDITNLNDYNDLLIETTCDCTFYCETYFKDDLPNVYKLDNTNNNLEVVYYFKFYRFDYNAEWETGDFELYFTDYVDTNDILTNFYFNDSDLFNIESELMFSTTDSGSLYVNIAFRFNNNLQTYYYNFGGEVISFSDLGYQDDSYDFENYDISFNSDIKSAVKYTSEQFISNFSFYDSNLDYQNGYDAGFNAGEINGINIGYSNGYSVGFNEGSSVDETAFTIFNGILNIALVPINFFLSIFNFEILGINISGVVSALLTICVTIIIIKTFMGGKGGDTQ